MKSGPKSASNQDAVGKSQPGSRFFGAIGREEQAALMIVWTLIVLGCGWSFISANGVRNLVDVDEAAKTEITWRVDLNTATRAQLMAIPGFGKKISTAIIEDRKLNGPFATIEDLCRVRGIGEPMMEKARPFLVLDDASHNETTTVQHRVSDGNRF